MPRKTNQKSFQIALNIDALLHRHDTLVKKEFETVSQRTAESSYVFSDSDSDSTYSFDSSDSDESIDEKAFYGELQAWMKKITTTRNEPSKIQRTNSMHLLGAKNAMPKYKQQIHHPIVANRMRKCNAEFLQNPEEVASARKAQLDPSTEKPGDKLKGIIIEAGLRHLSRLEAPESAFLGVTDDRVAAHSKQLTDAARRSDLKELKHLYKEGRNLQACNKFGESIVHIVCRRGNPEVLSFLIDRANVSLMVRDDMCKNPLHDAMWTDKPSFEMVKILMRAAPKLLFAKDKRGMSPLAYIPRPRWGEWCQFLENNKDLVLAAAQ